VALTTHPHLRPRLKKEKSYTSTPPLGLHGGYRVIFTCTFMLRFLSRTEIPRHRLHTERKKQLFPVTNYSSKLSIYRRHGIYNKRHFSQLRLATQHTGDRNSITGRGSEFPIDLVTATSRPALRFTQFLIEGLFPLGKT
jgi:hypothetical protein